MRSLIPCFSATGNTARAVAMVEAELRAAGHEVESRPLSAAAKAPLDCVACDLVIVAFPVLAMMPPVFVQRFLRRLPTGRRADGSRVRAAALAVDGGDGGPAVWGSAPAW